MLIYKESIYIQGGLKDLSIIQGGFKDLIYIEEGLKDLSKQGGLKYSIYRRRIEGSNIYFQGG